LADETPGSSVEGAGDSSGGVARAFHFQARRARARLAGEAAMRESMVEQEFAEELTELHDGSISLFVTLPVFRDLLESAHRTDALQRLEETIGEHLAYLDGILGDALIRRDRSDSELTRWLFDSLRRVRSLSASTARDYEILLVMQRAQASLMGSCSFALRCARQVRRQRAVEVLEESLARIGSLAPQLTITQLPSVNGAPDEWLNAVA
jgi:hypothetical protein